MIQRQKWGMVQPCGPSTLFVLANRVKQSRLAHTSVGDCSSRLNSGALESNLSFLGSLFYCTSLIAFVDKLVGLSKLALNCE
ncbi:hypothetical protein VNO78_27141 [Psophocarpus tetragonolobus]|uniref:Uncharacterized protein n=1 Tax=Psophocarpus tetragonolobus TaxID=3891 RepID=A0AAN9XA39_PSOTE